MISRHIDFDGMNNVRDMGGMTGADGRPIKNGLLFRSDHLHNATARDMQKLKDVGVRYVLDLRNIEEYKEQPDVRAEGITNIPLPLNPERTAGIAKDKKSREELRTEAIEKASKDPFVFLKEMTEYYVAYATVPYTFHQMHEFFSFLIHADGGVLWHCAGGKDRTGILAVLLCHVLGVSQADIEEDYLATNRYKQKEADEETAEIQKTLPSDCPPEVAVSMTKYTWLAHMEYLNRFYEIVRENHGSVQGFLREAVGLTEEEAKALREKYLA